jgi:thioredoxin 2
MTRRVGEHAVAGTFSRETGDSVTGTFHIVCPHCGSVNRVPSARLEERPHCGQCHEPLFTGHPITLSAANFDRHASRADIPLVVDFWAPWCGPCRTMAPAFEQAARVLEPKVRLAKVNTEEAQALAARFGIVSIPTLIIFRAGHEVARQPGAFGQQDIVRWVRSHV